MIEHEAGSFPQFSAFCSGGNILLIFLEVENKYSEGNPYRK